MLRPYQQKLKSDIYQSWGNGARHTLAVLPTGGGKSVVVQDIAKDVDNAGEVQAIIAHRNELVAQMSGHIARAGIMHRLIAPQKAITQITRQHREEFGRSFVSPNARAAVVGVDTLRARASDLKDWAQQVRRWTIDEAHHTLRGNKWGAAVDMFPNAFGLGVTASPCRADGAGLGSHADGVYDDMVIGPDLRWLIDNGSLSDYEIVIPASDFRVDEKDFSADGDLSPKKGRQASVESRIVGDVAAQYVIRAYGKRAICFATDVETAKEMAEQFNALGVPAAAVSGQSDAAYRDEMIRRFRDGRLLVLVNVDLFGEGFDVPACEVVIMARPTASLAVYLQQFGRALRLFKGKTHGLIIDHVSNVLRHGLPDKPHFWTLDRREKRKKKDPDPDEIALVSCKSAACGKPYEAFRPLCPYCGYVEPADAESGRSPIARIDGDLILLDRSMLEEMRKATELPSAEDVGHRAAYAAGPAAGNGAAARQSEKITAQKRLSDAIDQWAGVQRSQGFTDQEIYRRFYLTMGATTLDALHVDRTRADYDKTAEIVEGWFA